MYTPSSTAFLRPTRGGGFEFVEYDNNAFPYPQTIGDTAPSISGLGPADENMLKTIFIMPNKGTDSTATMMIVVDEKEPSTDPKTYQYVYVGNINDLPSDVLTESSIVDNLTTERDNRPLSAKQGRTLNSHVNYTTCGSGAADQVKLISDDGFELSTHLRLLVKMTNTNTNSIPKFNINNTGIKDVWYNGAIASDTNTWSAGEVLDVYYDGTSYITNTHGGAQFSTGEKVSDVGIDNEPTAESNNLIKSLAVYNSLVVSIADIITSTQNGVHPSRIWGTANTYISVDCAGLYEIASNITLSIGIGQTINGANVKTYYGVTKNNRCYFIVSNYDYENLGVVRIQIQDCSLSDIIEESTYIYSVKTRFCGIALPNDTPFKVENGDVYLNSGAGLYSNFGNLQVFENEQSYFLYNSNSWKKIILGNFGTLDCDFVVNGYISSTGEKKTLSTFSRTRNIKVRKGDVIICDGYATSSVSVIAAYDINGNFLRSLITGDGSTNYTRVEISADDIDSIIISLANSTHGSYEKRSASVIFKGLSPRNLVEQVENVQKNIIVSTNVAFTGKQRINSDGSFTNSNNYVSTDYIPVTEKDKVVYSGLVTSSNSVSVGGYSAKENGTFTALLLGDGSQKNNIEIEIPSGVKYVVACSRTSPTASTISFSTKSPEINKTVENNRERISKNEKDIYLTKPKFPDNLKIAVIGDSIATGDAMNPYLTIVSADVNTNIQAYITYWDIYNNSGGTSLTHKTIGGITLTSEMIGTLQTLTPNSDDVGKKVGVAPAYYDNKISWPYKMCDQLGAELINASWSGASLCSGQGGMNPSNNKVLSYGWSDYTIGRCKKRDELGNDITPNIIIIARGVNDFSHLQNGTNYAYLDFDYDLGQNGYPETDVFDESKRGFYRAYYLTIYKLRNTYPNAIIYCATLNVFKRVTYDRFPTRNGMYTLPQMNDAIRQIANTMGCGLIEFDKDGITFENCYNEGYITDSSTIPTHPSEKGHEVMARKAVSDIKFCLTYK